MSQQNIREFFSLYQQYRFEDQVKFYKSRVKEFEKAHDQAVLISITLLVLTAIAGTVGSFTGIPQWLKLGSQLAATLFPILSTAIAAYNSLYGFEQQAKLYQDSIDNLISARDALAPIALANLDDIQYTKRVDTYVENVEKVFQEEQGQWGQLAEKFKPPQE